MWSGTGTARRTPSASGRIDTKVRANAATRVAGSGPAHHRLVPDAQGHDVEPAQLALVTPVQRPLGAERAAVDQLHGQQVAEAPLGQVAANGAVLAEGVWGGHDLGHQLGPAPARGQHGARLAGVHRHARLAQHVLARRQRRQRDGAVQIGPGANHDGVAVVGRHQLRPALVHRADPELLRHPLRRRTTAVAHADEFDVRLLQQPRQMPAHRVGPGAHHADPYLAGSHGRQHKPRCSPCASLRTATKSRVAATRATVAR